MLVGDSSRELFTGRQWLHYPREGLPTTTASNSSYKWTKAQGKWWTQGTVLTQPCRSVSGVDCDSPWGDYQNTMCIWEYYTIVGGCASGNMVNANGRNTWNRGYRSIEQGQANTASGRCAQETQNSLRYSMSKFAENMPKMPKKVV
jgi:hypothetical protein